MSLSTNQNQSEERHRQLRAAHDVLQSDHHPFRDDNSCLEQEHQALQEQYRQREVTHAAALQTIIQEWRGSEDFIGVADEHAMSRMPTLLRSWLTTPYMSGQPMVDAMMGWQEAQDYR